MGTYNDYYKMGTTDIIDVIYPVGSVYLSMSDSFNPQTAWGGTWKQISEGYALWTATSGAGGTISAGLPQIYGYVDSYANLDQNGSAGAGAFKNSSWFTYKYSLSGDGNRLRGKRINFYASDYNSIYGSSSTVQPPAIKIYAWRRTA